MNENELNLFLVHILQEKNRIKYYRGVYTSNELFSPKIALKESNNKNNNKDYRFSFIVNTLSRKEDGIGHWLAISVFYSFSNRYIKIHFFDRFGQKYYQYGGPIKNMLKI